MFRSTGCPKKVTFWIAGLRISFASWLLTMIGLQRGFKRAPIIRGKSSNSESSFFSGHLVIFRFLFYSHNDDFTPCLNFPRNWQSNLSLSLRSSVQNVNYQTDQQPPYPLTRGGFAFYSFSARSRNAYHKVKILGKAYTQAQEVTFF